MQALLAIFSRGHKDFVACGTHAAGFLTLPSTPGIKAGIIHVVTYLVRLNVLICGLHAIPFVERLNASTFASHMQRFIRYDIRRDIRHDIQRFIHSDIRCYIRHDVRRYIQQAG